MKNYLYAKLYSEQNTKDFEVLEFVLKNYSQLKFSPSVDVKVRKEAKNPN